MDKTNKSMSLSGFLINNVMSLLVFPGVQILAAGDWRWWV
jgi:hypothetical protein